QPGVDVEFHVRQPDLNMVVSGHELIHILPGGVLKAEANIDPGSAFQSNRISINLIIPAEGFAGHRLFATSAGTRRTIAVPTEPLFPIQFATGIKQLWLPRTGMEIRPLGGVGVLEDLRHYNLSEFWYEQQADYTYPQIVEGARRYVGLEVSFGGAPDLTQ
ncbi:MAG: hypothetical protein LC772_03125, partial [Chloroflexi bacterium]|nr:hypothetical protein [Chloroflexota bacterium]